MDALRAFSLAKYAAVVMGFRATAMSSLQGSGKHRGCDANARAGMAVFVSGIGLEKQPRVANGGRATLVSRPSRCRSHRPRQRMEVDFIACI
ncbi:MAG: hypothetical protein XE11_2255 [Methanomicrobiales archaeon 53_19]|nr:MAG: hypothetical protein XE11_2255 [Methanomicrobiales archaeon 53_19]